jgi:hypothetical protein
VTDANRDDIETKYNYLVGHWGLIIILIAVIGWFATSKDSAVLKALDRLEQVQTLGNERAEKADAKMLDAFNKLCERMGGLENRVGVLEFQMPMPWADRQKYFYVPKNGKTVNK